MTNGWKIVTTVHLCALAAPLFAAKCIVVRQGHITGQDLAAANPAFAVLNPAVAVALSPLPGLTRTLTAGDLAKLEARYKIRPSGPLTEACFERESRRLDAETLRPVLEQALGRPVEILDYTRDPVPPGPLEFAASALAPSGLWRGRVRFEGRTVPIWAKIATGQGPPGQAPPWKVERGDHVSVEVRSGLARIHLDAEAVSAGKAGDLILFRNPLNGHIFRARAASAGKVVIVR